MRRKRKFRSMSEVANLTKLAREAASCRRCALWEHATQTVFGDGPPNARLILVGEFVIQRGKRRIHQKPNVIEIEACRYWFEQELTTVRPEMVVALGATAARAVFGREMAIQRNRGRVIALGNGSRALITVHPSFLLRLPDESARDGIRALRRRPQAGRGAHTQIDRIQLQT